MANELGFNIILSTSRYALTVVAKTPVPGNPDLSQTIPGYIPQYRITRLREFINQFKDNDKIWGFMLMDEPHFDNWYLPTDKMSHNTIDLTSTYKEVETLCPDKAVYFNLAVDVSKTWIGGLANNSSLNKREKYYRYLEMIYSKFTPKVLSYDYYPIYEKQDGSIQVKGSFYLYLECIGEFSTEKNLPIWAYPLSNQHDIYAINEYTDTRYKAITYPKPIVSYLRFQVFSALACGAQGILYWTYGLPENKYFNSGTYKGEVLEEYFSAPLNKDLQPTSIWNALQLVNREVNAYSRYFLNSKYISSVHAYGGGTSSIKKFEEVASFNSTFYCINGIHISDDAKGVMLSYLRNGSNHYLVIVSHDPKNDQTLEIDLSSEYKIWTPLEIVDTAGNISIIQEVAVNPQKNYTVRLVAGGFRIFKFAIK